MPRIKLAIVSPSRSAYSETFIQAHKNGLDAEVSFYFDGALPRQLEGHGALRGFTLVSRIKRKLVTSELTPDEEAFADSLKSRGVQVLLAEYGPTAVQVLNVCEQLQLPMVVHFHGYDASQFDILERYSEGYKEIFKYASRLVVVSEVMKKMLQESGAPEKKLILNRYGPDPSFLEISRKEWNGSKFLSIGRFVDKKAPYYTLLAFSKVLESHPEAELTMAGDGPLLSTVRNIARHLGIAGQVKFLGPVNHSEVLGLMKESSCYIQHSIRAESGDMEGSPVAIIEAAAAGLPVVATRHAGIPEVIDEDVSGYLVEEHAVDDMAKAMIMILDNPERSHKMGIASREKIATSLTMQQSLSVLDKVISEAAR